MIELYKKYRDQIWWSLIVITTVVGIYIDTLLGLLGCLLIGIHFYISLCYEVDSKFSKFDAFGVGFVATVIHMFTYIVIVVIVTICIHKEEIKVSNSYNIKYLENEKIVILKDNNLEIINDAKLYWECRAKNCSNIIITTIKEKPINSIYSKNLPTNPSTIYSVNSVD